MKLFSLLFVVVALLALLSGTNASPKGVGNAIKKGGKIVKGGLGALGAVGTGHEIYQHVKNRG